MPLDLSETGLFNLVLDPLAEEALLSADDDVSNARWLRRNYPSYRDALLQQHPWKFASKRALLAEDATTPAFEYLHRYLKPADCLRVLPITTDGYHDSQMVQHIIEGQYILTNLAAPLKMRYIARITNISEWSAPFAMALAHWLRAAVAFKLSGKLQLSKMLQDALPGTIANAQLLDGLEGVPDRPDDDDVIAVR